jgi:hypothetical protein
MDDPHAGTSFEDRLVQVGQGRQLMSTGRDSELYRCHQGGEMVLHAPNGPVVIWPYVFRDGNRKPRSCTLDHHVLLGDAPLCSRNTRESA